MSTVSIGLGIPPSMNTKKAYSPSFVFDLGSGYQFSKQFSIWLDLALNQFSAKNNTLTHNNNLMMVGAALWIRTRLTQSNFCPYIFVGPGITYNEYRSDNTAQLDETYDILYVPVNSNEVDFLIEGGVGIALNAGEDTKFFIQGKISIDFISTHFANFSSIDSPLIVLPIETGILLGY